jgi:hypothetical protein
LAESVGTLGNNSAILPNRLRPFCRNGFCRIVWHSDFTTPAEL